MSKSLPVTLHLFPPGTIFKAQVSRNAIFVCSVNRKFFLWICCCSESKHQCLMPSNSNALYCFKPRASKTCWPCHTYFFSDRPVFCQVFIDPHPECSWSVWCPCMLSTCLGDLSAAQGSNIHPKTAQTNEFLGPRNSEANCDTIEMFSPKLGRWEANSSAVLVRLPAHFNVYLSSKELLICMTCCRLVLLFPPETKCWLTAVPSCFTWYKTH